MYDVALLIERQLNDLDAAQIIALHEGLDDTVRYHLLLPVESSNAILTSSMSALGSGQIVPIGEPDAIEDVQEEIVKGGQSELEASAALIRARGQEVTAKLAEDDPIDALVQLFKGTGSSEAIILTEPHIVREFLRIDWTSRAQRKLDVPSVHLLEHVPFDAQR